MEKVGLVLIEDIGSGEDACVQALGFPETSNGELFLNRHGASNPILKLRNLTDHDVRIQITDIDSGSPPENGVFPGHTVGNRPITDIQLGPKARDEVQLLTNIGGGTKIGGRQRWHQIRLRLLPAGGVNPCPQPPFPPEVIVEC